MDFLKKGADLLNKNKTHNTGTTTTTDQAGAAGAPGQPAAQKQDYGDKGTLRLCISYLSPANCTLSALYLAPPLKVPLSISKGRPLDPRQIVRLLSMMSILTKMPSSHRLLLQEIRPSRRRKDQRGNRRRCSRPVREVHRVRSALFLPPQPRSNYPYESCSK